MEPMKYAEILNRIELAAECVIKDIELDQREPEELAAEGIASWEKRPISEVATEIGQLMMQQFIEVLPLPSEKGG